VQTVVNGAIAKEKREKSRKRGLAASSFQAKKEILRWFLLLKMSSFRFLTAQLYRQLSLVGDLALLTRVASLLLRCEEAAKQWRDFTGDADGPRD